MKILANDGISESGKITLESAGFKVISAKVAQNQLENFINDEGIDALIIKANTTIDTELIDACPSIKLIANQANTTDNIDTDYAEGSGIQIIQVADASANAIAELVFAHLLGMARFLHQSNREMPLEGDMNFNNLKKQFANGTELRGKTLGIIGMESAGQQVAKLALGLGMKVIAADVNADTSISIPIEFYTGQVVDIDVDIVPFSELLTEADFISLHVNDNGNHILEAQAFEKMKDGVGIVNVAQAGLVDEIALVNAIESGKVSYAALDAFENQPTPEIQLLMNTELSLSPNIATSTIEANQKSGKELATQIISLLA